MEENLVKSMEESLNNIDYISQYTITLSVESGFISNINSAVNKRFKSMAEVFNEKVAIINIAMSNDSGDLKDLKKAYVGIKRSVVDLKYVNIESRLAPVTLGLKANLLDVTQYVTENNELLDRILINSLEELSINLSRILSDTDYRRSFKPKKHSSEQISEAYREIRIKLTKLINPSNNVDRLPVGRLIPNVACIPTLVEDTTKMGMTLSKVDMEEISNLIKEIVEKVNILHDYMKDENSDFTVTKDSIETITKLIDSNANLITVAMTNYTLAQQQIGMVNSLIKIIKM